MSPWIPRRYLLTYLFTKYLHIQYIDALNEAPPHHFGKKINPPMFASTRHRKFYDVIIL